MFIAQMESSHLLATIKLRLRKITELKYGITNTGSFSARLLLVDIDEKKVLKMIESETMFLYPYIFEAVLRDLDLSEITESLQEIYERDEAVSKTKALLPPKNTYDHDDDYDEEDVYDDGDQS